jgi:hypothetical protein
MLLLPAVLVVVGIAFDISHGAASRWQVVELLLKDEVVMSCQDVKAVIIRPGVCRFKAEIQFNPTT